MALCLYFICQFCRSSAMSCNGTTPMTCHAGRVAISRASHAEHRIRLPSSGTGNRGPRQSINGAVSSFALWPHRLHQQKTDRLSFARSAKCCRVCGLALRNCLVFEATHNHHQKNSLFTICSNLAKGDILGNGYHGQDLYFLPWLYVGGM